MDYYNTMRTDFIHKAMYPEDPMRVDWIPKGPPQGTLTIKPKERCAPRIVTKIEGAAVEEGHKVFFEGIVDAKPQPKFSWYFNDEPIFPGFHCPSTLHQSVSLTFFKFQARRALRRQRFMTPDGCPP